MSCLLEDDVVARFLDGDVDAGREHELEGHLRTCDACQRALARSRHLDAVLAARTDVTVTADVAQRLMARALAAAATTPAPTRNRRPLPWIAAAAGFALGLLAMHLHSRRPAPAPIPAPISAAPAPTTLAWPTDMLVLPERNGRAARSRAEFAGGSTARGEARRPLARAAELLDSDTLATAIAMQAMARARALGLPPADAHTLAECADASRAAIGLALLAQAPAQAVLPLCRAIDQIDEVGCTLRDAAATQRDFRGRLRVALQDGCPDAVCAAAARLGDVALDRRLLLLCRRDDRRAHVVADACATAARGVDRVEFLLDLWAQAARTAADAPGTPSGDVLRAQRWFAALPATATATLLDVLRRTRSGEVRHRAFLALAARGDESALAPLLQWIESPNATDASLAAYALGCYDPRFGARVEAALPTCRRPELLWAALASQGHARMRPILAAAGFARAEIDLVSAGNFHPDQIAAVASLLRGRTLATPNQP